MNLTPKIIFTLSVMLMMIAGSTPAAMTVSAQDATAVPNERMEAADILAEGWETYYQEDYEASIESFSQVVELEPNWAEGYSARAYTYFETGDYEAALADFARAAELDNNDAVFYTWISYFENGDENYRAAIEAATSALEFDPRDSSAYNNRAYAYEQLERYDEALADYTQAVRLEPFDYIVIENRAYLQEALDNDLAVELDNRYASGLRALAEDDDPKQALSEFSDIISQNMTDDEYDPMYLAYAYYHRGLIQQQSGNLDDALDDLTSAIDEAPDFANVYLARAQLYLDMEQPDDAWADLNRAAEVDPGYPDTYLQRARLYEEQGDQIEAAADYWRWMQTNQQRDVVWKRYLSNVPFAVDLGEGWIFKVPFRATAGQVISVSADEIAGGLANVDPLIVILDADEQPIMSDNDSGSGFNAEIVDFVLPADGFYTLAVSHGEQGCCGSIRVNLALGE